MDVDGPWGKLEYVNGDGCERDPVPLIKRNFIIGRAKDCDLVISRKMVSAHHCFLELTDEGIVYLHDTSSNGTLFNGTRRLLQEKVCINSGDRICIAHNKGNAASGVSFIFRLLNTVAGSQDDDDASDATDEYSFELRDKDDETADGAVDKEVIEEQDGSADGPAETRVAEETGVKLDKMAPVCIEKAENLKDDIAENLICSICQEILYKCVSLLPCMHCFCAGCYSEWMKLSRECPQCRAKVVRIVPNHVVNGVVETLLRGNPSLKRNDSDLKMLDSKNKITREMLYPKKMKRLYPFEDEGVAEGDYDESDDQDYDPDAEEHEYSDVDDYDADINSLFPSHSYSLLHLASCSPLLRQGLTRSRKLLLCKDMDIWQKPKCLGGNSVSKNVRCRQCPGNNNTTTVGKLGSSADNQGCSAGSVGQQLAPHLSYACLANQVHLMCRCCRQYMPSRAVLTVGRDATAVPPQSCINCFNLYCHLYWGCRAPNCRGCLGRFEDLNFGDNCLDYLIKNNTYESLILSNYLKAKGITVKLLTAACLQKYREGTYAILGSLLLHGDDDSYTRFQDRVICVDCGLKILGELAYQFRRDIQPGDLPPDVARPDCYWGSQCRTQVKFHHAKRFNHICEQTRFN